MKKILIITIVLIFVIAFIVRQCDETSEEELQPKPCLTAKNPNHILWRDCYITSYNPETRCPNWVAWVLTKEMVQGSVERHIWYDNEGNAIGIKNFNRSMVFGSYIYDAEVEEPRPEFADWLQLPSGMSHGHICPAGDCHISESAMNQSFLLTNICVQAENLNSGSWNRLEMKSRDLAMQYGKIYIISGPVFYRGEVSVWMGNIAIPDAFFKVLLRLEGTPKAIGFLYPNTNDKQKMQNAVRTVNQIEELTGFDFFSLLSDDLEDEIECQANLNDWK